MIDLYYDQLRMKHYLGNPDAGEECVEISEEELEGIRRLMYDVHVKYMQPKFKDLLNGKLL